MFHVEHFWFRPNESTEEAALDFAEALLVWIQSEEKDEADRAAVLRKMVKNIRWLAQKVGTSTVILHSFAHLGESKAKSEFADALIDEAALRLRDREYVVHIVPFGAFHEFKMHVKGPSLLQELLRSILNKRE
ncbi:MAG: threonyl-tRNA synthetase editing domain-containing protein [Candidatus Thorarchaeota archaeon]